MPRNEPKHWEAPIPPGAPVLYRPPAALRPALRQQCIIYFEEELYALALQLLSSTLIAGTSTAQPNSRSPAFVPPPYILALLGTLVVHPSLTTRTTSHEKQKAADSSLTFLQHTRKLVGARNSEFGAAFQFANQRPSFHRKLPSRRRTEDTDLHDSDSEDDGNERVRIGLAEEKALWTRAEDFWHVLGWAFNCSVNCEMRWKRWELWVAFMLDVLEDDLFVRVRESTEQVGRKSDVAFVDAVSKSIIAQYLECSGAKDRSARRRIMRAVLANGDKKAMAEFKEIWAGETKLPKADMSAKLSRVRKIDIEADDYGDYLQSSEAELSEAGVESEMDEDENFENISKSRTSTRTPKSTMKARHRSASEVSGDESDSPLDESANFGSEKSLHLRRRVLVLLAHAATYLASPQFTPLYDLLATYSEFLRPLPLPIFTFFIGPSPAHHALPSTVLLLLNQLSLQELLETAAPRFEATLSLTQLQLCAWYLPWTASKISIESNAKVSLLVESITRLVHANTGLAPDGGLLRTAAEKGIRARMLKCQTIAGSKSSRTTKESMKRDSEAELFLQQSAARLKMLIDVLEL